MACPDKVTWTNDIQGLFTPVDVACMKKARNFDLSSYDDVKANATQIYQQVSSGNMPKSDSGEPPWPQAWVDLFLCWIQQNFPEN